MWSCSNHVQVFNSHLFASHAQFHIRKSSNQALVEIEQATRAIDGVKCSSIILYTHKLLS
jgi:hypothetical protein